MRYLCGLLSAVVVTACMAANAGEPRVLLDTAEALLQGDHRISQAAFTHRQGDPVTIWRAQATGCSTPSLVVPGQVVSRDVVSGEVTGATGDGAPVMEEIEVNRSERTKLAPVIRSSRDQLGAHGPATHGRG